MLACISAFQRKPGERGIALIVVLWVLALLTVVVVTFSGEARTDLQIARNQNEAAQRAPLPMPASLWRFSACSIPRRQPGGPPNGKDHALAYGGGTIRVSVQDEAGKIDLNYAPAAMLAGLFQTQGSEDVDGLTSAVIAWRNGAGAVAQNARPANGAPSQPFLAIDELRLVPGMTRAIYDRVAPFVTVYSSDARINPLTAPAEVLKSLPGATAQQVDDYLAERAQPGSSPGLLPGAGIFTTGGALRVFTVTSQGRTANGVAFTREAVAVLTGVPEAPYRFLSWREMHRLPPPPALDTGT